MTHTAFENARGSEDQNPSEFAPIFVVVVDDQRDSRVLCDIFQTFELLRGRALGLFIDRRVEAFAIENKANWNNVRLAVLAGCGEMGDTGGAD